MEGIEPTKIFEVAAAPWTLAFLTGILLLHYNRENRNPLEWSTVDRCLLLMALTLFAGSFLTFWFNLARAMYFDVLPYINWSFAQSYFKPARIFGITWVILFLIGWWLRARSPESRAFALAVTQYIAITMAGVCYMAGIVSNPGPFLYSMAIGILIFLLFKPAIVVPWMVTFLLLIICSTIAILFDLIPYSIIYMSSPYVDGKIDSIHLLSTIVIVLLDFLLMLSLLAYIFARWRDREVKVVEMTALLKKMFGRYLSTEVMNSLVENPSALELGGERRRVTIMMTDLRGFTALSERLEPEQVVHMLNTYFEVMVDVVIQYNGTISEIIGDALLVIFGAPQEMSDRAQRAIACAIDMQNTMAKVNQENRAQSLPDLEMGIGLNEAEVIVGNIGSSKRSNYTVVGSGVNMASRIESYTVGGQVLISESIKQEAGGVLRIDDKKEVMPKGAESPLTIYEIGGIGGQYNVALEGKEPVMVTLVRQIPLLYKVLGGKHVDEEEAVGRIIQLSKKGCEVALTESISLLTNLNMNLGNVDEELAAKDFYGKVVEHSGENEHIHMVRFTAVPPEVSAYFQAYQQHAVEQALC